MVGFSFLETKQNLAPAGCASLEVGCFYELDHSKLPPKAPELLKSIRIVMVMSKTALFKVSVRFPSLRSLKAFLSVKNQLIPVLDEEYLLEPETASEILYRRVPPEEIWDRTKDWSFWARRRFEEGGALDDEASGEGEDEHEEENQRRKHGIKTQNKPERQQQDTHTVGINLSEKRRMYKAASEERWCAERYKMAEDNMLKARGTTAGNPLQRPALRNEARKVIGDTGLLDHLLKHMAGKVAPGGAHQFQRRHNADGTVEYWLQSADLVGIRKEAGVQDPCWTPPQGWNPGDDPSQDLICATIFKEPWDEIAKMKKREKESKQPEQGLAMVPTTSDSLVTSMNWDQDYTSVMQLKDKYTQLTVWKSNCEEQMLDLVPSQSPHVPIPGSSSGSLVKPFAERRAVNTSTLLCNVTPPVFTRVPSEIEKITSPSHSFKTLQINLNECAAISRPISYHRRHQLVQAPVMGYANMCGLKGTTAIGRIGWNCIYLASDMRGSIGDYISTDVLTKIFIEMEIACVGVGRTKVCQMFTRYAFNATGAAFGHLTHPVAIYFAAKTLQTCIDYCERTTGVSTEMFLVCGFSNGEPLIFTVRSTILGGISCGRGLGYTRLIGSGCRAGHEFVMENEHILEPRDLVDSTIVYASLRDPSTGGHVHSVEIPLHGDNREYHVSVLELLWRDFNRYATRLQSSLFFQCPTLHYTSEYEELLLQYLIQHFPRSQTHIISRLNQIIRMIYFDNVFDYMAAWEKLRYGAVWHCGQQSHTLSFYESTADSIRLLAFNQYN